MCLQYIYIYIYVYPRCRKPSMPYGEVANEETPSSEFASNSFLNVEDGFPQCTV